MEGVAEATLDGVGVCSSSEQRHESVLHDDEREITSQWLL